jgi:hypothetical protein
MKDSLVKEKLEKIFYECDKHLQRINSASKKMHLIMPLTKDKYLNLTEDEIEHIDQFLFRFSKLQDAMGQKLFRYILLYLQEDIENKPFIDILNLMEKINLIDSAFEWKLLRDDRNELAHNYEDNPEEMSIILNRLYNKKEVLERIYLKIKNFYKNKEGM